VSSRASSFRRGAAGTLCRSWAAGAVFLIALSIAILPDSLQAQSKLLNKPAPEFVRTDLSGRQVDLKALRGKVVLLNFWATWCGPCQVELPQFQAWQDKYGSEGLQVIAVSMDDEAAPVRAAVRRMHLRLPVVMGDDKLGSLYGGVLGLPITFLIARDGTVVDRHEGAADPPMMERKVRALLALHPAIHRGSDAAF
jgi:thiol-disulfide isomerase/thioredoxin